MLTWDVHVSLSYLISKLCKTSSPKGNDRSPESNAINVIPFSIDISWFSNLFETDETERPWWIMCSYIRLSKSNRYWKNRSFDHPQAELDILSFQKTYTWAMETRGPKSNSSELLCLSWLPATLMMIRSKMNDLAWRHHFPIISLTEIF